MRHPFGRWRPSPYLVFGGLFWLVMSLAHWRIPGAYDYGQHAAVIERLKADLPHPRHPMADLPGTGSPYFSPYAVVESLFARFTGLSGWETVRVAGPVNLLVLLIGIGRFVRALTPRRWAPVLALVFMTVLWGTRLMTWSGFLGLMSMALSLGYPSTFAIGLALLAWALTGRLARAEPSAGLAAHAGLGALCGLILLIHPITSVAAVLGVVAFAAGNGWRGNARAAGRENVCTAGRPDVRVAGRWDLRVAGRWGLTGVTALAVAAVWPYFSVFSLIGDRMVDGIHVLLYRSLPERYWLALIGLPVLLLRLRRNRRDPLVLMFALECLVVAYGWTSGHYTYGRIIGLTLIPLQFALAVALAAPGPWGWPRKLLGVTAAAGACAGFLSAQAGAVVPRALDPVGFVQPARWPDYRWAARHIRPGEPVLTDGYMPLRSLPGHGADLVAPVWPDPALAETDRKARRGAVATYLSPRSTRAERTAIVRRYHARWLLLGPSQRLPEEAVAVDWSRRTGEVLARIPAGEPYGTGRPPAAGGTAKAAESPPPGPPHPTRPARPAK
ncbi:hypothetical protein [Streptomyces tsukubensis]|uniref:Integral membrane protein n=1 Tax=Streptomyces tsukubensis TaxID=83656 RepID=A0A1V4A003_9ACTN|nr:hypothetical protein [Streptomyces tsukubensis]OON72106.1 hypothetical protein B1H18_30960 [Streptomyces tsukubensis]